MSKRINLKAKKSNVRMRSLLQINWRKKRAQAVECAVPIYCYMWGWRLKKKEKGSDAYRYAVYIIYMKA